jgi:YD repeat-containing protein
MALIDANQVYLTGYTESTNFPLANPFDNTFGGGTCGSSACHDAYVTHLNIANNQLVSSSYLGGSNEDEGAGITVDSTGDAYVTGYTKSTDFPTLEAIQPSKGADSCSTPPCADAFVVKVSATGNPLIYSTYLGGSGEDYGNAITQDGLGGAYVTGHTLSSNFPTTSGAYDTVIGSASSDVFVAKIFDPLSEPPAGPLTIDYTYDALHRPTSATYSDGRSFGYTYDPAGNVLELQQNLGPGTVTTTYTYDTANQLNTAQQGSTTWNYTYDANGSLSSDGVKTYTYDSANRLVEVGDQSSVTSLTYNGLGQRLSMDAAGVIAHYVLDGDLPLTAESSGNTTFFLYGRGPIGEKTTTWNYSLLDGTNTPRQLTAANGDVTLSARYTPCPLRYPSGVLREGGTLELNGTGNFTFGYIGGILDAATGLLGACPEPVEGLAMDSIMTRLQADS